MKFTIIVFLNLMISISTFSQSFLNSNFQSENSSVNIFDDNFAQTTTERKSVPLAVFYSLLLPGMGEYYVGDYSLGKYFTIADASLWLTLFGVNYYATSKRNDYIAFAQLHAYVNPEGKDDVYWGVIGNYDDIFIYNDEMDLMRQFDKLYDVNTHYWKWDEVSNRKKYRSLRSLSETAFNNIKFVISALILNRIASAVNSIIVVKSHNRKVNNINIGYNFGVNYFNKNAVGFSFNIYGSF